MSLDVHLSVDVDTGGTHPHTVELYWANITHNLGAMAREAGVYTALWHPESMRALNARCLIDPLERGLALLKAEPERFRAFDAPNGWGTYEQFLPFVEGYLVACKRHPLADVHVSR